MKAVGKMLEKTLAVQYEGDKAAADKFIDQYTTWDDKAARSCGGQHPSRTATLIDSGCLVCNAW